MDLWTLVLPVVVVLALSAFARGIVGFGNALIAMPLLALIVSVRMATPLVALANLTVILITLLKSWRDVDVQAAWRLILSSLIGIPLGLFYLKAANESLVKAVLGIVLVVFGLYYLVAPRLPALRGEASSYAFGLLAGALGGAYNTNGPPIVVYGTLRGWPPESFRATLQGVFLPTSLMVLVGHGLAGLWTPAVLRLYVYALPVMLLATVLGSQLGRRIPSGPFRRMVYAFLVAMGVLLVARA